MPSFCFDFSNIWETLQLGINFADTVSYVNFVRWVGNYAQPKKGLNMWGCYYNGGVPILGYFFSNGLFSLLFWIVLGAIAIILITKLFKKIPEHYSGDDRKDSMEILKIRYAKGEIGTEEFLRMKQILTQQ